MKLLLVEAYVYNASMARKYKLPCFAFLLAARKAFCAVIAAVGMSTSLQCTHGCDVMKVGVKT